MCFCHSSTLPTRARTVKCNTFCSFKGNLFLYVDFKARLKKKDNVTFLYFPVCNPCERTLVHEYVKINSHEFSIKNNSAKSAKISARELCRKEVVIREIKVPLKFVPAKICDIKVYAMLHNRHIFITTSFQLSISFQIYEFTLHFSLYFHNKRWDLTLENCLIVNVRTERKNVALKRIWYFIYIYIYISDFITGVFAYIYIYLYLKGTHFRGKKYRNVCHSGHIFTGKGKK